MRAKADERDDQPHLPLLSYANLIHNAQLYLNKYI